jgi:hypothetical protein
MKKLITILSALLLSINVIAQTPQKMTYQAVIRNASNTLVASTTVGMRVSILQGSSTGTPVYIETQTPTTNANGLVTIEIGAGAIVSGNFSTINWGTGSYFVKTETDPTGGTSYSIIGTSQLNSVPYALYAANASSYNAGSGISISSGTITNTAPNQTVAITGAGMTNVTGTYPNFTVNTPPYTAGTGISIGSGTITNTAPNQTVSLTGAGSTTVTGSYPNFTVNSPRNIHGTSSGGFAPTIINGSGFTAVHTATGFYTITFTTPFTTTPTAVASIYNLGFTAAQIEVTSISTTNMVIKTYNVVTGPGLTSVDNIAFSFIVMGN